MTIGQYDDVYTYMANNNDDDGDDDDDNDYYHHLFTD